MCSTILVNLDEKPAEESFVMNEITDIVFLLIFGSATAMWAVKGSIGLSGDTLDGEKEERPAPAEGKDEFGGEEEERSGPSSTASEEGSGEFGSEQEDFFEGERVKLWVSKPPKSVMQGL